MSSNSSNHRLVSSWLGVSKRVSSVTEAVDEASLSRFLSRSRCHLCILLVSNSDQALPECTFNYPHMRVLAITTDAQVGDPEPLFQQGANDVVSLHDTSAAQHAISRLIDECIQQIKMGALLSSNSELQAEVENLKLVLEGRNKTYAMRASNDNLHDTSAPLSAEFKVKQAPVIKNVIKSNLRDAATGLPSRNTVMQRFSSMLHSDIKAPRFTALLVRILTDPNTKEQGSEQEGVERNVQDLTFYRAADALQKCVAQSTIMGRINQNALLMIQPSDVEPVSRDAANRVRESLGTLGGLIDAKTDVHIDTMNLPSSTNFSADEVLERLETLAT